MTQTPTLKEVHSELFTVRHERNTAWRERDAARESADRLAAAIRRALDEIGMLREAAPGLVIALQEYEAKGGGA